MGSITPIFLISQKKQTNEKKPKQKKVTCMYWMINHNQKNAFQRIKVENLSL